MPHDLAQQLEYNECNNFCNQLYYKNKNNKKGLSLIMK